MTKKSYFISNVVYGPLYLKIFQDHHLRSILDDTNLPAIGGRYDITYGVFTDAETLPQIMEIKDGEDISAFSKEEMGKRLKHANLKRLNAIVDFKLFLMDWSREDHPKFEMRYTALLNVFKFSVDWAVKNDALLTAWVADLVVARDFFPKIMSKMEAGHGAVFVLPLRSAFEPMAKFLNQFNRAIDAKQLFNMAYANLHPLWVACEVLNRRFTKLPFCLLWSTPTGVMARSFSVTPIVFKPKPEMLESRGMIDGDIPAMCDNPHWCEDWTDAPVIGVEPLFCYAGQNIPGTTNGFIKRFVKDWSRHSLHPSQLPFLRKRLYYPDKKTARIPWLTKLSSDRFVRRVTRK